MDVLAFQNWSYPNDLPRDIQRFRELLEKYSKIPSDLIECHLFHIREQGWRVSKQPFIGRWRFLRLPDASDLFFEQARFRLTLPRSQNMLLDIGCGVGQNLRQLRAHGVRSSQMIGVDIEARFIELGYQLFQDKNTLGVKFIVGNVIDPDDTRLNCLTGLFTIIQVDTFFHLFSWSQQLYLATRLIRFLRPDAKNALIYGRLAGIKKRGVPDKSEMPYLHTEESFQRLWEEAGALTGTKWGVVLTATEQVPESPFTISENLVTTRFGLQRVE